jgi:hypothetical protein
MVKNDDPVLKDVVKAAANVTGEVVTYNQGFQALKAEKLLNTKAIQESYNLIIPSLKQFKELNEGSEVHYYLNYGKIEGLFLCPNFMNENLHYVRTIMSLDAAHLKSLSRGTLYLATVKTGLNELYKVAIGIERANEGYDGWNKFLFHLKNACPLMAQNHPKPAHQAHAYFTFVSDRYKGLVQALQEIFPINHSTQCCIHIKCNVTNKIS